MIGIAATKYTQKILKSIFNLHNQKKARRLTSPDCTFSSCLPSDVGGKRQSLGSGEEDAWDAEGGVVWKGGGGAAPWLPAGSAAGMQGGSGTKGRTPGNQQQQGQDRIILTVCTKGLTWKAGKHSQCAPTGIMASFLLQCKALWGEKQPFRSKDPYELQVISVTLPS